MRRHRWWLSPEEAKGQVQRWYDGHRIVVSDIRATYRDGRLPAPPSAHQLDCQQGSEPADQEHS
jgi:hypothetical protein